MLNARNPQNQLICRNVLNQEMPTSLTDLSETATKKLRSFLPLAPNRANICKTNLQIPQTTDNSFNN